MQKNPNKQRISQMSRPGSNDYDVYSTLPKSPEQDPYHQMQFSIIPRTPLLGAGALTPRQQIQSEYFKPCRQDSDNA